MRRFKLFIAVFVWAISGAVLADNTPYAYPLQDPVLATIIGTPDDIKVKLPSDRNFFVKTYTLAAVSKKPIPDILFYAKDFKFNLAAQNKRAPLIFVIAGTGGNYLSTHVIDFMKVFYQAGYHVISISSPTSPDFMVSASAHGMPGYMPADAQEIYTAMQRAITAVKDDGVDISDVYLTGYSLGAAESAFVSWIDDRQKRIGIKKVFMVNPPVDLLASASLLDGMLKKIPGGEDNYVNFLNEFFDHAAQVYFKNPQLTSTSDFLQTLVNLAKANGMTEEEIRDHGQALIGISFRLSSGNLVFTADALNHAGFVIPKEWTLSYYEDLYPYMQLTNRVGFDSYFKNMLLPFYQQQQPGMTEKSFLQQSTLVSIESYLKNTSKIRMVTNADELILRPQDLHFLKTTFGARGHVYPYGGHCGNMFYADNINAMLSFFAEPLAENTP